MLVEIRPYKEAPTKPVDSGNSLAGVFVRRGWMARPEISWLARTLQQISAIFEREGARLGTSDTPDLGWKTVNNELHVQPDRLKVSTWSD